MPGHTQCCSRKEEVSGSNPCPLPGAAQVAALSLCPPWWPAGLPTLPSTSLSAPSLRDLASSSEDEPTASPAQLLLPCLWHIPLLGNMDGAGKNPPETQAALLPNSAAAQGSHFCFPPSCFPCFPFLEEGKPCCSCSHPLTWRGIPPTFQHMEQSCCPAKEILLLFSS